MVIR
jgi:hypothetical protein